MKVLIAEDEQELARAEQTILAISHIEADIAHDGQEAIDALEPSILSISTYPCAEIPPRTC